MSKILLIGFGGFIGACLRYAISGIAHKHLGSNFPWGTLTVNLIGAFAIGFFWQLSTQFIDTTNLKLFVLVGMIGSLTTFSTYSLETLNLIKNSEFSLAAFNILASNILGILIVFIGILVSKYLTILCVR